MHLEVYSYKEKTWPPCLVTCVDDQVQASTAVKYSADTMKSPSFKKKINESYVYITRAREKWCEIA